MALGWQTGTYVSTDGGLKWELFEGAGLHGDVHGLYFDPTDKSGKTLYIGSDGGVAVTRDGGATFDSGFNKYLAQLQLYGTTAARDFYGTLSLLGPLAAAGSQDNGNLYCVLEGTYHTGIGVPLNAPSPWVSFEGGDGGVVTFSPTGQMISASSAGGLANLVARQLRSQFIFDVDPGALVLVSDPGQPDDRQGLTAGVESLRGAPKFVNAHGQSMYAVGFSGLQVYGLFANLDGRRIHLEHIGSVKSDVWNDYISAVGSADGSTVFLGTAAGRMFQLSPARGQQVTGKSLPVTLPPFTPQGIVNRIVDLSATKAFATFNFGWSGLVLGFDGASWTPSGSGLPGDAFQGLAADDSGTLVFADTADHVFVSDDGGKMWLDCSAGLPNQPHCMDLRFIRGAGGQGLLYLNTFGRSLWCADLPSPVRLTRLKLNPSVVQAGQMSRGTVTLNGAAPPQGSVVTLGSSDPTVATVPASVTVQGGASSATFGVLTHKRGSSSQTVQIVAALVDIFNVNLTIKP